MDYILIDAPMTFEDRSENFGYFIPYNLYILDYNLRYAGYKGRLLIDDNEVNDFFSDKNKQVPSLIGISSTTYSRFNAIKIIKKAKVCFPNSKVITGGVHFGNCPEDAIKQIPEIDIVVRGEGDEVIIDLMKNALGEIPLDKINGITYRDKEGCIVSLGNRLIVESIGDVSFMDQNFQKEYFETNWLHKRMKIPALNVLTGRGCPHKCIFCSVAGIKNRKYSVKSVVDFIEKIVNKFGIKGIRFEDDSLTMDSSYIVNICDEIRKRNLNIIWYCQSRANIDLQILRDMYEGGCRFISVGLESASPKIQKILGKNISNEHVLQFAQRCSEVGINCYVYTIASLPEETPDDLQMTIDFAQSLRKKYGTGVGRMMVATIYPGTKLENIAIEKGILQSNFSWNKSYYNKINTEYDQVPYIPIYIEHITPEIYKKASKAMRVNYALSLSVIDLMKVSYEQLFIKKDISLKKKLHIGFTIIAKKMKNLII